MSFLEKNLAAIESWTPATARAVHAAAIPPGFEPVSGTDGSPTFLRAVNDPAPGARRLEWLGGTSMPSAAAPPLIAALEPGLTSGLGLSIGTGYEWRALAAKIAPSYGVYVYEPDPALLRMALTICDLHIPLSSGKILLFTGSADDAGRQLAAFLNHNLGYEPPVVLHPLPTLPAESRNPILAAGEAIVRRAVQSRHAALNSLLAPFESAMTAPADAAVALLATARYAGERPLHREIAAKIPQLRVDHHTGASLARRIEFLTQHRPARILSDFFRGQLACIPPTAAVHTWIPPLVGPAFWQPDRLPAPASLLPQDRIIVHAQVHQQLLETHGIPKDQIRVSGISNICGISGISDIRDEEVHLPDITNTTTITNIANTTRPRVALIADLPRCDTASLGIQLPTQQAIYSAAREFVEADYLTVHFHNAPDLLRRALRRAGITAGSADTALQEPMLRVIRDVLIPAIPLLTLARTLLDQRINLLLIGDWTGLEHPAASDLCIFEPFAPPPAAAAPWPNAALLVHLSPWGTVSPLVLDAADAGIPIIAPRHPTDTFAGALPALLPANAGLTRPQPQQLLPTIKSLLRAAPD